MIRLQNICKTFNDAGGKVEALKNITLDIGDGEIFGIIGMSGAGKSTLVRCINMLEVPTEGEVVIDGVEMSKLTPAELRRKRREITMIFQGFNLLMQRTCLSNVCFPMELAGMKKAGSYQITREQADRLAKIVLVEKTNKAGKTVKTVSRECVGRSAPVLLSKIGIEVGSDIRCIIAEVGFEHDFVQNELMMPILGIVRVKDIDEAIELACKAEGGRRHSAHMHSKKIDNLSRFAREVETTIFVKNAPSYAGIGFGGEGHTTFTIAGPTGEGITSARSFTRQRRCVMADSFRII